MKRLVERPDQISRESFPEKLVMFFCLVPIFGMIPATIALTRQRSSQKLRNVSQVAIALMIIWATGYSAMGGMPTGGEQLQQLQITTELLKASLSSGYFGLCIYLMYRLHRQQNIQLPWQKPDQRDR
ncbi:MAG: hypothetical protein NW214_14535 [Pseudanabaenaceae cyanobacterium bins.39]|nr:hypothetical protein [Pseudanabaenaceae cyanobacterium bins.39]